MITKEDISQLKPFQARAIIEELRKGSVPSDYVPFFTVGREKWLTFIEDDFDNYISHGGSKVRFISGDYGDGKTHFMSLIKHMALEKNFAISFIILTRDIPIHKFEVVYQTVTRQLQGNFDGMGIRHLLDQWAKDVAKKEKKISANKIFDLSETIKNLPGMNINFANGLVSLLSNKISPLTKEESKEERSTLCETLYHWFEGGKVTKKELKPFGIFEVINKTNSKLFLNSLKSFLRYLGYSGLILLMDELETVMAQSTSVRNAAYENVRLLIDNTEQAEYLHIFFAIIPDALISEKGFKSYDALWSRIRSIGEQKRLNYRGVLVDLHRTPLNTKEFLQLGEALRHIHEISYRWEADTAVLDTLIEEVCINQKKMGLLSEVRLFIKQIIRILDMAEQGEEISENMDLKEHIISSQKEMELEKIEQLQPTWDA